MIVPAHETTGANVLVLVPALLESPSVDDVWPLGSAEPEGGLKWFDFFKLRPREGDDRIILGKRHG